MPSDKKETDRDYKAFIALLVLLIWLPLPLGSNRAWAWGLMEAGALCILAYWIVVYIRKPYPLPPALRHARAPLILFCLWILYTFVQSIPLPPGVVKVLSPASYSLHQYALGADSNKLISLSVNREATLIVFLKSCAYITVFMLTMTLVNSRSRLRTTMSVLVLVGLCEALYGLFNTLSGIEYIWWNPKTAYRGLVTGTFINRNHFAGHMEIIIPIGIGLLISRMRSVRYYPNWKARVRSLMDSLLEKRGRLAIYIVIMFAALFLSASRAGVASLFIALAVTLGFSFALRGRRAVEKRYLPFILVVAFIAALWLGLGALPDRYASTTSLQSQDRYFVWQITRNMISDYPVFGSGAGTFQYLFPMYEDGRLRHYFDHAHNDYLELLSNHGAIGFFLGASAVLITLFRITTAFVRRRDLLMRSVLFASLTGALSLFMHAIVDFNFQIPANAAYFFVLIALGITAASLKRERGRRTSKSDSAGAHRVVA